MFIHLLRYGRLLIELNFTCGGTCYILIGKGVDEEDFAAFDNELGFLLFSGDDFESESVGGSLGFL